MLIYGHICTWWWSHTQKSVNVIQFLFRPFSSFYEKLGVSLFAALLLCQCGVK